MKIINEEIKLEDINPYNRPVVSRTDIKGIIIYTNTIFQKLSGYAKEELFGKSHNIIRQPDMLLIIFKNMWETISNGKNWQGIIKNLRKNGKYYWVEAHIQPVKTNNIIVKFISARRAVSEDIKNYTNKDIKK